VNRQYNGYRVKDTIKAKSGRTSFYPGIAKWGAKARMPGMINQKPAVDKVNM
jgi:hypothetical protein